MTLVRANLGSRFIEREPLLVAGPNDLVQFLQREPASGPFRSRLQIVDRDPAANPERDPNRLRSVPEVLAEELAQVGSASVVHVPNRTAGGTNLAHVIDT